MERLWAPWRVQYIGVEQPPGCLFCRLIKNPEDPGAGLVVWRPEGAIVVLNKFPYNPGHLMVAPDAHVASPEDLDDAQTADLMRAVRRTFTVLRNVMKPDGLNGGLNVGRAAGAGIPDHMHMHIVPRWDGDTSFMVVVDDVKVVNEALDQTAAKLRQAFAAT